MPKQPNVCPTGRARANPKTWLYLPHSSTSKPETQSWWTCWPTSTSNFSIPHRPSPASRNSSRSSPTSKTPCQDISQAGKQMGLQEGSDTRSALLWRVADAVEVLRPKYLLQENVAALVSSKFMPDFQKWLDKLSSLGYVSRWARLNAKNYGVPQNRDRVFCISMRKDVAFDYQFPEPFELRTRLEDVLENEVADRYFLKDDAVSKFLKANDSDNALFMQFDLPPTHEAAMFLKTVLQIFMERHDGWDEGIEWNEKELSYRRPTIARLYEKFKENPKKLDVEYWRGFYKMFKENMERNKDAN